MPRRAVAPTRLGTVPWPDEAVATYTARGYWEGRALGSRIAASAAATPDATCLVDGDRRFTYRELMARADGAAARLAGLGLRADDRVIVQLPNCWEFVVLTVACLRLGAVPVWTLPVHRKQEIATIAAHVEARAIAVPGVHKDFDHEAMAHEVAGEVPSVEHVLVADRADTTRGIDLHAVLAPAYDTASTADTTPRFDTDDSAAPSSRDVALFMLSGGTTGMPKLVPRTHDDLGYMITRAIELCEFDADTVYLAVLPLGHGFPMTGPGVLGTLIAGGRVVIAPSPAPEPAFAAIERERVTATSVVPTIVQRWLTHRFADRTTDISTLSLVQVGGSRLADHVARQIPGALGCTLQQVFGMSEGLLCLTRPGDPPEVVFQTQGRPICPDDEIRLVDEDGEPVAPGEPGVLLTRGPYTTRGYFRSEDINARTFTDDGWYCTGDIVRVTGDGNLIVEGREKDVINRGGEKISAEEIENFAHQVPGVADAAAVAMPNADLGERICLYVVAAPGHRVALDDVIAVMTRAGTARFKLPERLVTVNSLPSTAVGKVDKKSLRADIAQRLADEASQHVTDVA